MKPLVAALLYGDHPELARRCLSSILSQDGVDDCDVAVWCNDVSKATLAVVAELFDTDPLRRNVYVADNIFKYPVMRHLLYRYYPYTSSLVWLDDDAYFTEPASLSRMLAELAKADLVGWVHTMPYRPGQLDWISQQPWFSGKTRSRFSFVQGSCWAARSQRLRGVGYPWPDLRHCGGDSMLGEVAYQQGWVVKDFRDGIRVNADLSGKINGSQRRGYSEPEIGSKRWLDATRGADPGRGQDG